MKDRNWIAYIEIGNFPAESYLVLKGKLPIEKEKIDIYWYEEDIAPKEFAGEVNDLLEFYDTVVMATPLPNNLRKEVEKYGNEAE